MALMGTGRLVDFLAMMSLRTVHQCKVRAGSLGFEQRPRQSGLPDDSQKRTCLQFTMVRYRYSDSGILLRLLHNHVAALDTHLFKAVPGHDLADFFAGEDAQSRHFLSLLLVLIAWLE